MTRRSPARSRSSPTRCAATSTPSEQCDAFEALRAAGVDVERIAADFALPVRTVRQRLRLTKLSPAVRAAWRDHGWPFDCATAFTTGDASYEQQDALLQEILGGQRGLHPATIRVNLMHSTKAVAFDTREARYVGLDAYVAAGGRVEEDLFADVPLIFDEALLKRLARDKMMAAGEAILFTEGYAFCRAMEDVENATWQHWERIEFEYTEAEQARLDGIEEETDALFDGSDDVAQSRLEAEADAIDARAYARVATPELRAKTGILVAIDPAGAFAVERGLFAPAPAKDAPAAADPPRRGAAPSPAPASAKSPKPADPVEAAAGGMGMIRTILDDTVAKALVVIVGTRPDLALMFAVARFGGSYAPDRLEREFGLHPERFGAGPSKRDGVLGRLDGQGFETAISAVADVPLADLTASFAAIAARSIRLARHATLAGFEPVMRAFARRGAALGPAFRAAFDAERYFAAATRAACLAALEAMATDNVERGAKKPVLAALAAADAKRKGWLPCPLAEWAALETDSAEASGEEPATPAPPLAQAMGAAIDADEARRVLDLLVFLTIRLEESAGDVISCLDLYEAYRVDVDTPFGEGRFVDELFELGCLRADGRGVGDVAFVDEVAP